MTPADSVRAWALGRERAETDRLSDATALTLEQRLLTSAYAHASRWVGPNDAEDATHDAYIKAFKNFDPARGAFPAFFMFVLRRVCLDWIEGRRNQPVLVGDMAEWADSGSGAFRPETYSPEDEVIRREVEAAQRDIASRMRATVEELDLTDTLREMLQRLIDGGVGQTDADRKKAQRIRDKVDGFAGLTPEERATASLRRRHRPLDADARRQLVVARQKILRLFGINREGDQGDQ